MSTKPLFLLRKAKKSSGEPDVVLWASNDFESTCATLDYLIVKSGKKLSSYFKAVATNFPVVNDLPAEGEIDFTRSERYQLSKDSMTWELKPGAAPDDVHHRDNAQETKELAGGRGRKRAGRRPRGLPGLRSLCSHFAVHTASSAHFYVCSRGSEIPASCHP